MKKFLSAAALALLCLAAALFSGGSAGDPLISRAYLEGAFSQSLEEALTQRLDEAGQDAREALRQELEALSDPGAALPGSDGGSATLKGGDVLTGSTGLAFTLLGGEVRLTLTGGGAVDVTSGTEAASGQTLTAGHRYLVAEGAGASFTVLSPAAVASWEGRAVLTPSAQPDWYEIACALRALGLFRGSGSAIGEGFDLYLAPTRGEGLVMFLRLLGEEPQALAWEGSHPFTDVPAWLDRYVAWAWQKGYANGVAPDRFGPDQAISAVEYEEFLLRALGYSVAGVHDYTTSLERALDCGALTNGEYILLTENPFLRAHVAYVSYYSLDMAVSGGRQTLAQRLLGAGLFTREQLEEARLGVESQRIY